MEEEEYTLVIMVMVTHSFSQKYIIFHKEYVKKSSLMPYD
jgi:hypothetical protein